MSSTNGTLYVGGLLLPAGSGNTIRRACSGSFNMTFTGPTTLNTTIYYFFVGDVVTLQWDKQTNANGNATANFVSSTNLDASLRPANTMSFQIPIYQAGSRVDGIMRVFSTGAINILSGTTNGSLWYGTTVNGNSGGTIGIDGSSVCYNVSRNLGSIPYISSGAVTLGNGTPALCCYNVGSFATNMTGPWSGSVSFTFYYVQIQKVVMLFWPDLFANGDNSTSGSINNLSGTPNDMPAAIRPDPNFGMHRSIEVRQNGTAYLGHIEIDVSNNPKNALATFITEYNNFHGIGFSANGGSNGMYSSAVSWFSSAPTTTSTCKTYLGGLALPSDFTGAVQYPITTYTEGNFSLTFNGPSNGNLTCTFYYAKIGNLVFLQHPDCVGTATGSSGQFNSTSTIAASLRPAVAANYCCRVRMDGSTWSTGHINISTSGNVNVSMWVPTNPTATSGDFTANNGNPIGWLSACGNYRTAS